MIKISKIRDPLYTDLAGFLLKLGEAGQRQYRDQGPGLVEKRAQRRLTEVCLRRKSVLAMGTPPYRDAELQNKREQEPGADPRPPRSKLGGVSYTHCLIIPYIA